MIMRYPGLIIIFCTEKSLCPGTGRRGLLYVRKRTIFDDKSFDVSRTYALRRDSHGDASARESRAHREIDGTDADIFRAIRDPRGPRSAHGDESNYHIKKRNC